MCFSCPNHQHQGNLCCVSLITSAQMLFFCVQCEEGKTMAILFFLEHPCIGLLTIFGFEQRIVFQSFKIIQENLDAFCSFCINCVIKGPRMAPFFVILPQKWPSVSYKFCHNRKNVVKSPPT